LRTWTPLARQTCIVWQHGIASGIRGEMADACLGRRGVVSILTSSIELVRVPRRLRRSSAPNPAQEQPQRQQSRSGLWDPLPTPQENLRDLGPRDISRERLTVQLDASPRVEGFDVEPTQCAEQHRLPRARRSDDTGHLFTTHVHQVPIRTHTHSFLA
jgi:hypothetical protein